MKKCCIPMLMALAIPAYADNDTKLVLDEIQLQLTAKEWVSTTSAKLQISINATLNDSDLVKARSDIMANLNKIAEGDWHVTQFVRSQDNSGLEKLFAQAQARVSQQALTKINVQAKAVSKPGATYKVSNVDFTPSDKEVQVVKAKVRGMLYQRIQQEIAALNKQYPLQKYSVHQVLFNEGNLPMPLAGVKYKTQMNTMALAARAPSVSVSNEVQLSALVNLASNRVDD